MCRLLDRVNEHYPFIVLSFLIRIVEALGNAAFLTASFAIIAKEFPDNVATTFVSANEHKPRLVADSRSASYTQQPDPIFSHKNAAHSFKTRTYNIRFYIEGPRSRCYGRTAALRLIVQHLMKMTKFHLPFNFNGASVE
jgi:hypothetical protein